MLLPIFLAAVDPKQSPEVFQGIARNLSRKKLKVESIEESFPRDCGVTIVKQCFYQNAQQQKR